MNFCQWLDQELTALDALDRAERDGQPPILVSKRADGTPTAEFIEFVKTDADGEHHLICNTGGLAEFEKREAGAVDVGEIVGAINDALATVADLSKRVDALTESQADLVEVDPAAIVAMFTAAVDEAGA